MPNRLAQETSPYLLQHAENPVDWYPWGPQALARARELDRPIFLSIGYSACHWCHVMERESFEDPGTAALMNRLFVNVKVDREERPDLDEIYMKAVQALTGQGGWPMSVFLTPELEPFYGGTYFPPDDRHGRPGFPALLNWIDELWTKERERATRQAGALAGEIERERSSALDGELDPALLDRSLEALAQSHDPVWGGFGRAPKFPHALDIRLLLRHGLRRGEGPPRDMATRSLDRMAQGGIYDHLAGGFARYSTDEKWLVPHFEKMLYDNALLVPAYLEALLATSDAAYGRVALETADWMLAEMGTPEGGLASSLDADTEGVEGRFYVWSEAEMDEILGSERSRLAKAWFGVSAGGNFEGTNVLWRSERAEEVAERLGVDLQELEAEIEVARTELKQARDRRTKPGRDDKVLTAWNGLAISALAQTWQVLGEERHLDAARGAARYILEHMRQPDGRLYATARHGRAHLNAYLDDYAFLIQGLLDLYESDFDPAWVRHAIELNDILEDRFLDVKQGGYFTTSSDHEKLLTRLKSRHDGALPSGLGVQALNLLRLAELTGEAQYAARAEHTIRSVGKLANQHPSAVSQLLLAVDFLAAGPREIVLAGDPAHSEFGSMLQVIRGTFLPQRVVAAHDDRADVGLMPLLEGKQARAGRTRAFVCRNYTCGLPAETAEALAPMLEACSENERPAP